MARRSPCLFLKRLLAIYVVTEPATRSMSAERSVHSAGIAEVHQVPINVINRPIPPVLDEEKVKSLMKTIEVREAHFTCNLIYERVHERRSHFMPLWLNYRMQGHLFTSH